jgi:hypothetical protein
MSKGITQNLDTGRHSVVRPFRLALSGFRVPQRLAAKAQVDVPPLSSSLGGWSRFVLFNVTT